MPQRIMILGVVI